MHTTYKSFALRLCIKAMWKSSCLVGLKKILVPSKRDFNCQHLLRCVAPRRLMSIKNMVEMFSNNNGVIKSGRCYRSSICSRRRRSYSAWKDIFGGNLTCIDFRDGIEYGRIIQNAENRRVMMVYIRLLVCLPAKCGTKYQVIHVWDMPESSHFL